MFVPLLLSLMLHPGQKAPPRYPCLPATVQATTIVSVRRDAKRGRDVTVRVQDTLKVLHARCVQGRLVDAAGQQIRFFRFSCFGAPSRYAMETMRQEREDLAALRRRYTVIELIDPHPCA